MSLNSRTQELFEKLIHRQASKEELAELAFLLQQEGQIDQLSRRETSLWEQIKIDNVQYPVNWENLYAGILKNGNGKVRKMTAWRKIAVAASIAMVLGLSAYLLFIQVTRDKSSQLYSNTGSKEIDAPSKTKATITLVDGRKVSLDSVSSGILAQQGDVSLIKTADGAVSYQSPAGGEQSALQYNTITNPRGSKVVSLKLADGTMVWLNAESSLTYPVKFAKNERKVSITGEAYFEVAHNFDQPFTVNKGETNVQVLGTHFNVNAYDDEANIKVTLFQGAVKVTNGKRASLLKPGQEALIASDIRVVDHPDLEEVMAWKNGMLQFNGADISVIMRQVSRWYDVQVVYEGSKPTGHYKGKTSRNLSATQMLKVLEFSGIKFRIEDQKIVVTNNE